MNTRIPVLLLLLQFIALSCGESVKEAPQIKAFCIDFNWGPGGVNAFAGPGHWAAADPAEHVRWYEDLGCNVIQAFAVSCNGHAWYKNGFVPEQPGLKYDFLTEMVRLGHERKMKVFGYFCVGANTKWGQEHPELSYGFPAAPHIPFTNEYLDYLSASISDAVRKTHMDGFMIDWAWNPDGPMRWLECEKRMYAELMDEPFPGKDAVTPERELQFRRKAIDRCWNRIRDAAKDENPECIIWLSCNQLTHPDIAGSALLREVDWIMNEAPDTGELESMKGNFGAHSRLLQCMVGWGDRHNPKKILSSEKAGSINVYGFSAPLPNSLLLPVSEYLSRPIDSLVGNDRNVAVLARYFNQAKLEELRIEPPSFALMPMATGDSIEITLRSDTTAKGVQVHYTLDGSDPDTNAPVFTRSMRFAIPLEFKGGVSYNGSIMGGDASFAVTRAFGCPVDLKNAPSPKYRGNGPSSLTDGILGNTSYTSGTWIGFEGGDLDAVVDLGEPRVIREISLGYMVYPFAWIFEPVGIQFHVSQDGSHWRTAGEVRHEAGAWNSEIRVRRDSAAFPPTQAKFVRVIAKNRGVCPPDHPGKGGRAWIFVDEISAK